MTSKSILYLSWSAVVAFLCTFMINSLFIDCVNSTPTYKEMEIIDDLPVKTDLDKYLTSLEKIVNFADSHKIYVDLNLDFGIFLINVNLKSTLQSKGHQLNAQKRIRLERLLKTNEAIQKYFVKMFQKAIGETGAHEHSGMVHLFSNDSSWPKELNSLNIELLKKTKFYSRKELEMKYFKWLTYKKKVFDMERSAPNPLESDQCLELLSQNPINDKPKLVHCQVTYTCAKLMLQGSHFGYGMSHRILFILMARLARACTLRTPTEDRELLDELCAAAYNEVEFIVYHDFELVDLLMEYITLCSLDGHAQFVRRSWIDEIIDFQTSTGCFHFRRSAGDDKPTENSRPEEFTWQIINTNQTVLGHTCNLHTTAVAAATISATIRYILENYY